MKNIDPKELQLLHGAFGVFTRLGVKAITMDDVARELGVSKKTLYVYFKDKSDLLTKTFQYDMHCDEQRSQEFIGKSKNAIEELLLVNEHLQERFTEMHASVVYDLQKFYPEVWSLFKGFKHQHVLNCIAENINRGKAEELYRQEVSTEIYARLFIGRFEVIFDIELFPTKEYKMHEIHLNMIEYHVRAMATTKGLKQLEKHILKQ